jgi:transcriptional regulator with XRE-family HTH domain
MLGTNIKTMREIKEVSQQELAERIGVPPGTLSHIERGSRKPSIDMLYTIADALNISIINFFLDEQELQRFYFDDVVNSRFPGSQRVNEILSKLIENGLLWDKTRRVMVVDIDDLFPGDKKQ